MWEGLTFARVARVLAQEAEQDLHAPHVALAVPVRVPQQGHRALDAAAQEAAAVQRRPLCGHTELPSATAPAGPLPGSPLKPGEGSRVLRTRREIRKSHVGPCPGCLAGGGRGGKKEGRAPADLPPLPEAQGARAALTWPLGASGRSVSLPPAAVAPGSSVSTSIASSCSLLALRPSSAAAEATPSGHWPPSAGAMPASCVPGSRRQQVPEGRPRHAAQPWGHPGVLQREASLGSQALRPMPGHKVPSTTGAHRCAFRTHRPTVSQGNCLPRGLPRLACPSAPDTASRHVPRVSRDVHWGSNSWLMVTPCSCVTSATMVVDLRRSSMCTDRHSPAEAKPPVSARPEPEAGTGPILQPTQP